MSHATVLVIGNNFKEQLAPYDENIKVPEYCEGAVSKKELKSFRECYTTCKKERTYGVQSQKEANENKKLTTNKLYAKFGNDWNGNVWKMKDGKLHEYSTCNPKSKWDWYSVGGRWAGFFKLQKNGIGVQGHHRAKDFAKITGEKVEDLPQDKVDQARKCDIDFEAIKDEDGNKAKERFEKLEKLCGGAVPKIATSWETFLTGKKYKSLDIDGKRTLYHAQEAIKKIKDLCVTEADKENKSFLTWLELEEYQCSKQEYIQKARNKAIITFAVVKDGKWWGRSSDTPEEAKKWDKSYFDKFIKPLSGNTILTIVDYHI